jgi:hypothetical protein
MLTDSIKYDIDFRRFYTINRLNNGYIATPFHYNPATKQTTLVLQDLPHLADTDLDELKKKCKKVKFDRIIELDLTVLTVTDLVNLNLDKIYGVITSTKQIYYVRRIGKQEYKVKDYKGKNDVIYKNTTLARVICNLEI